MPKQVHVIQNDGYSKSKPQKIKPILFVSELTFCNQILVTDFLNN